MGDEIGLLDSSILDDMGWIRFCSLGDLDGISIFLQTVNQVIQLVNDAGFSPLSFTIMKIFIIHFQNHSCCLNQGNDSFICVENDAGPIFNYLFNNKIYSFVINDPNIY